MEYIVDGAVHARRLISDLLMLARIGAEDEPVGAVDCESTLAQKSWTR